MFSVSNGWIPLFYLFYFVRLSIMGIHLCNPDNVLESVSGQP